MVVIEIYIILATVLTVIATDVPVIVGEGVFKSNFILEVVAPSIFFIMIDVSTLKTLMVSFSATFSLEVKVSTSVFDVPTAPLTVEGLKAVYI